MPTLDRARVRSAMPVCTQVRATGQLAQHGARVGLGFRLAEDLAVHDHGGVGGEHRQIGWCRAQIASAFSRASRMTYSSGGSRGVRRLVDVGRRDHVRHADEL